MATNKCHFYRPQGKVMFTASKRSLCNLWLRFALHTSFRQKCLKLRCHDFSALTSLHWQTSLQNRQCHALCTLGKTSKCWLGLRPVWVVSHYVMVLRVLMLHGGSTNPYGDVTPWGRVAEGRSCCSWQGAKWWNCLRTEMPEAKLLLGVTPLWVELWVMGSSLLGTM